MLGGLRPSAATALTLFLKPFVVAYFSFEHSRQQVKVASYRTTLLFVLTISNTIGGEMVRDSHDRRLLEGNRRVMK